LEVEGKTYGGWYRVLANGHLELLALANMRSALRSEGAPVDQARAMLFDFIRTAEASAARTPDPQQVGSPACAAPADSWQPTGSGTLGDLLYADRSRKHALEEDWVRLVEATAAGDRRAFRELYERTHRLVFTLIVRITGNRKAAEELTLDVYLDIWRGAPAYRPARASVLAWIMNQARFRALAAQAERRDDLLASSSDDMLTPSQRICNRLAQRLGGHDAQSLSEQAAASAWQEPEWDEVAPGISCKLLATDMERRRVSMLVRLAPGIDYPPHTHAGVEELHLLAGELFIDDRKLKPGDYNRAEPGTGDNRVWSETGCMCVLVTSPEDVLR
jgi:DNA-directed RNA polymerase specialized sigma24 family protein